MAQSSWIIIPPFLWTVTDNWIGINRRLWPSAERVDLIRGQFHISTANMSGPWTSQWQFCRLIMEHSDASGLAAATFWPSWWRHGHLWLARRLRLLPRFHMSSYDLRRRRGELQILAPDYRQTFLDYPCLFLLSSSVPLFAVREWLFFVLGLIKVWKNKQILKDGNSKWKTIFSTPRMRNSNENRSGYYICLGTIKCQGYFREGGIFGMRFGESHGQVLLQLVTCAIHSCESAQKGPTS